jgi:hypothetical protein
MFRIYNRALQTLIARQNAALGAYKANPCDATAATLYWAQQQRRKVSDRRAKSSRK